MISTLYRKKMYGDGQTIAPPVGPWCHCRTKQMLILFWEAASHADVIAQSWLVRSSLSFDPLPTLLSMDSFCCSRGAGSDTSLNPASFGTTHNFLCPLSLACCLVFVCTQHCMGWRMKNRGAVGDLNNNNQQQQTTQQQTAMTTTPSSSSTPVSGHGGSFVYLPEDCSQKRRTKWFKHTIMTSKYNCLQDHKGGVLYQASENLKHITIAKKILGKKITDSL